MKIDLLQAQDLFDTVCDGCDTSCQDCTTSLEIPQCSQVMEHVSSPGGNTTLEALLIERGYWRATNRSREILACYNADVCRGGVTDRLDYCSTGYEGPCESQERPEEQTRYVPMSHIDICIFCSAYFERQLFRVKSVQGTNSFPSLSFS